MKKSYLLVATIFTLFLTFLLINYESNNLLEETEVSYTKALKKKIGYHKADKPDEYARYMREMRTRVGQDGPEYQFGYRAIELNKMSRNNQAMAYRTNAADGWVERGPSNVPGRTRGIIVLPGDKDKNSWLAGSVAGGIWKTTDAGQSYTMMTPDFPNLGTTSLAMSQSNTDVIYAGTGEQYAGYNAVNGDGMFKSTDGGNTWTQLASTSKNADFGNVNRIIVDPNNANLVLAATSKSWFNIDGSAQSRIMRSTNGGANWSKVYQSANSDIDHIVSAPSNFDIQYASINSIGVIKSIDGGLNWTLASGGLDATGRIELAVANNDPNRVYASVAFSGANSTLWVSNDGGTSWGKVDAKINGAAFDILGGQGFYDNTIAVHPYYDSIVYVGGVNSFKFNVGSALTEGEGSILSAEEDGSEDFFAFRPFEQVDYNNGSIAILYGEALAIDSIDISEFVSVEVRFGPGKSQKAHRYTIPANGGSAGDGGAGVPVSAYTYADYVDVPFELWDTDNNRQLMISWRDQNANGAFDLAPVAEAGTAADNLNREYLFLHAISYDDASPNAILAQNGARMHKQMYFIWPLLADGAEWEPNNLPESKFSINWGARLETTSVTKVIGDAYGTFGGGNAFTQTTGETQIGGLHPDHHNLLMVKMDEAAKTFKIIDANDGGVYVSNVSAIPGEANNSFTFAGNGYNTTQFYGVDKKPGATVYFGGTQDNGTWRSAVGENPNNASKYSRMLPADGFDVVWHATDGNKMLGTRYNNIIDRSTNGGLNWSRVDNDLESGPFMTKLAYNKTDPEVVYAVGPSGVWKTSNFATTWSVTAIEDPLWLNSSFVDVDISLANPDIVWAGAGMAPNFATLFVSTDHGASFNAVPPYSDGQGVITGMATHPEDDQTFYALYSFSDYAKIVRTTDLGQTWEDISGFNGTDESTTGFPDVAVFSMIVRPDNTDILWVGTEIGLVESTDGGASWHMADNGLENVAIWDMKVVDGQVLAATHGRGIWTYTIQEIAKSLIAIDKATYKGDRIAEIKVNLPVAYESVDIYIDNVLSATVADPGETLLVNLTPFIATLSPTVKVKAVGHYGAEEFTSEEIDMVVNFTSNFVSMTKGDKDDRDKVFIKFDIKEAYDSLQIVVNDQVAGTEFEVEKGEFNGVITLSQSGLISAKAIGFYDGLGFATNVRNLDIGTIAGLFGPSEIENFTLYPNPSNGLVNLELPTALKGDYRVEVYNTQGQQMLAENRKKYINTDALDLSTLPKGTYIITIKSADQVYKQRMIKQ